MWIVVFVASLNMPTRRSFLTSSALISVPQTTQAASAPDPYAHSSFFGLAPPPIEKEVSYDELVGEIINDNIKSVQIATQHDCVIATTIQDHRWSCLIPDTKLKDLVIDSMHNNTEVTVLPMDTMRSQIRSSAQIVLYTGLICFIAVETDIIKGNTGGRSTLRQLVMQLFKKKNTLHDDDE